jgi:hypothetical protein
MKFFEINKLQSVKGKYSLKSKVLMMVTRKRMVFLVAIPCSPEGPRRSGGKYRLHLQRCLACQFLLLASCLV